MKAKDQQAAEANKNATILLKELDLEKVSRIIAVVFALCVCESLGCISFGASWGNQSSCSDCVPSPNVSYKLGTC